MSRILTLEWHYLSDECKARATSLMVQGICDLEMAVEMAIVELGEHRAFELEAGHEKRRD
jgi:hypothetical protein